MKEQGLATSASSENGMILLGTRILKCASYVDIFYLHSVSLHAQTLRYNLPKAIKPFIMAHMCSSPPFYRSARLRMRLKHTADKERAFFGGALDSGERHSFMAASRRS